MKSLLLLLAILFSGFLPAQSLDILKLKPVMVTVEKFSRNGNSVTIIREKVPASLNQVTSKMDSTQVLLDGKYPIYKQGDAYYAVGVIPTGVFKYKLPKTFNL